MAILERSYQFIPVYSWTIQSFPSVDDKKRMNMPPHCEQVYDFFAQHRHMLTNEQFLTDSLKPHCKFNKIGLQGSRLRIIQLPKELAQFLMFMSSRQINRYLEVGTSTGGSWFLIDSYLRAVNPEYKGSVGYDRTSKLRDSDLYFRKHANVEFRHQSSDKMQLNENFDLAYIDACHLEHWVWHDFNKVKGHCRFVAFHDIVLGHGSTVDKFWEVAKQQYPSWEFIDRSLPETCGIGVLQVR